MENRLNEDSGKSCAGYLGPTGSFSHQAALEMFGKEAILRGTDVIEDIFTFVENGTCHQGIVPVENSCEGSVNITLDLLNKYNTRICAEFYLRIMHNLLSIEKNMGKIKKIYSHAQAIAQCRLWIKKNLPGVSFMEVSSTSYASKLAYEEPGTGAIGSSFAAEKYHLNVLRKNIEDEKDNITRFFVIGNKKPHPTGRDKTSLLFYLKHKPGALYKCLSVLAEKKVNMTRIESRPVKTKKWEYLFFVDIEGHEDDRNIRESFKEMEAHCVFIKILGSYPRGDEPFDD